MASPSDDSMDTSDSTSTTQTSDSNSGVSQPQNSPQVPLLAAGIQSTPTSPNFDPSLTQNQSQHPPLQTADFQSPEFYSSLFQAPPTQEQLVALLRAGFKSPHLQQFLHQILTQDQLTQLQPFDFQHPGFYSLLLQILSRDQLVALLSAAFQHPEFYSSLLQIMNKEQVVALLSAAFQSPYLQQFLHQILPQDQLTQLQPFDFQHPEFYSHLLLILSRDQLVALLSVAFQSTHVSSNVQLILAQTQNQDQLTAPQAASSHPTQTSSRLYPDLSLLQKQNLKEAAQLTAPIHAGEEPIEMSVDPFPSMDSQSKDPQSTSDGRNHQDNLINPIITQPPRTPSHFRSHTAAFGTMDTQKMDSVLPGSSEVQTNPQQDSPQNLENKQNLHPADGAGAQSDNAANRDDSDPSATPHTSQDTHTSNDVGANSDGGAAGGAEPLAPQDTAKVNIQVDWTEKIPDRWKLHLQKALQCWFNGTQFQHVEKKYEVVNLQLLYDPRWAVVEISPSQALDVLMTQKKGTLHFRELKCHNTVHFLDKVPADIPTEPISKSQQSVPTVEENTVPEVKQKTGPISKEVEMSFKVDLDSLPQNTQAEIMRKYRSHWTGNRFLFSGSFDTVEKNYKEICKIAEASPSKMAAAAMRNDPNGAETPQHAERSGDPLTLTVPISHYWYLSQAFRQDLRQFEEQCGVRVNAEALVSFTAEDPSRRGSVQEAAQKFTDFYHQNTRSLKSTEIPQTQLESEYGKEVVRNVQSDQGGLMLNQSAGRCQLFGPGPVISAVQKQMNLESHMETGRSFSDDRTDMETDFSNAEGRSWSSQTAKPVEMDIRDTPDSIMMNETHWKLMKKTSQKQIQDIEIKYGVLLTAAPSQGSVTVTVKSNNEHVSLESHALRAFTHLYQKVATTAVACSLKRPSEGKTVAQALGKLSCPDYFVGIEEKHGVWKLVGLPKHLGPVITEIEKLVGKSVFDDKIKELVGYPGNFPESWGLRGGQQELAAAKWTHGITPDSGNQAKNESGKDIKEKDDDKSKDDDCPICMDKFTDKRKLKCGHEFCRACLNEAVKSMGEICPVCKNIFGKLVGTQPDGNMNVHKQSYSLPGYPHCGTIEIFYSIPDGKQTERHPNPGQSFYGAHRQAYLPDNVEGREVLKLLQRAFDQRLIFTVGTSSTSGMQNTVTWNDIHHKTSRSGGPQSYGYPDPDYLKRVKEELKAKGIE